jgi:hypothetical protein
VEGGGNGAEIKTPVGGLKSKWPEPANSRVTSNDFRGLDPAESKQNGKIKSRKTLENRAAAPALLRTPQWGS